MPRGKGIEYERKIARQYREQGYLVTRSGASLGLFDLIAVHLVKREILLIQCKKGWSHTITSLRREAEKIKPYAGVYQVFTLLLHEE